MASSSSSSSSSQQARLEEAWRLTPYEMQRTPHRAITDDTEIAVSPQSLQSEFMCPICLDLLKKTMTTKTCFHRFCYECIITALRSGNKECPTCRTKLISKRSLQADPNFDILINKLYPDRNEQDALEREILTLNNARSHLAFINSIREGIRSQALDRQPPQSAALEATESTSAEPDSTVPGPEEAVSTSTQEKPAEQAAVPPIVEPKIVEIIFKPHPILMKGNELLKGFQFTTRYMTTGEDATVEHLQKYFQVRLSLESQDPESLPTVNTSEEDLVKFGIYIAMGGPGNFISLSATLTLQQILEMFWKFNKPLELFYTMEEAEN